MSRAVVPVRLSDKEREQIASAAMGQGLSFSGFLRQAALQASAIVRGKVSVAPVEREQAKVTILEPEPAPAVEECRPHHFVEPAVEEWRPHHFVEQTCVGCGLDVDDVRARDFPCEPVRSAGSSSSFAPA